MSTTTVTIDLQNPLVPTNGGDSTKSLESTIIKGYKHRFEMSIISNYLPTHTYDIRDSLPHCHHIFSRQTLCDDLVKYTFVRLSRYRVRNNNYVHRESRIVVAVVGETVPERPGLRLT